MRKAPLSGAFFVRLGFIEFEGMTMSKTVLGVLGGSGVYDFPGLTNERWERVESPWGEASDELHFGELDGLEMVFLPRHGRGHAHSPSSINYRANIDVLKRVGVTDIVSVSAVGSLKEELPPGHFVIVDQFIDRTFAREKSFFGEGCVAHVSMADPVSLRLGDQLEAACKAEAIAHTRGGTYLAMEGPQFSSRAESELYRSWGCSVIGMTNMPEAKLAREAEICYATVAMVTDYDCWHPHEEDVDVAQVIQILNENADKSRAMLRQMVGQLAGRERTPCPQGHDRVLDMAIITGADAREPKLLEKLDAVAGRVL
jgi:5'-methylthioadenosine phosphorylase